MMTTPLLRSLGGITPAVLLLFAVACNSSEGPTTPSQALALSGDLLPGTQVDTVLVHFNSGIGESAREVIRTQEEWAQLWERAHGNVSPAPERPAVDLSEHILVVAAMGSRPTGGYAIAVDAVSRDGDDLFVRVEERSPASGCIVTQAVTSPLMVVRVPDAGGQVAFVEERVTFTC